MAKVDLHVHSCASAHPSVWFLKRIGTRESYTLPETIYRTAKDAGMDFVTITDHNTMDGVLELIERHPDDVFTGVEVTSYFPEDNCKIHVLVYGLTQQQFAIIDSIRKNIYELRTYLRNEKLAHAVAHTLYSVNGRLTIEHIEKLFLLFDYFEGMNGSRNQTNNEGLMDALAAFTPERIERLYHRYRIEPFGDTPWEKGIIGGSDDHSGMFCGQTWTEADATTPETFLEKLSNRVARPGGRHNDYQGLAFAVYKVAYDFSQSRTKALSPSVFSVLNTLLFHREALSLRNRFVIEKLKFSLNFKDDKVGRRILTLIETVQSGKNLPIEAKMNNIETCLSNIADELFTSLFQRLEPVMKNGDLIGLLRNVTACLPGIFLSIPFFTTMGLLHESRHLLDVLVERHGNPGRKRGKKVLWFTDTLTDLNGVSETIRKLAHISLRRKHNLVVVSCPLPGEESDTSLSNVLNLPCIHTYTPSYFESYTLRIPSILSSMRMIYREQPDEIYVSTPGPVGILGLVMAKLLHIRVTGIFHTDFTLQAEKIINDESVCRIVEDGVRLFYSQVDTLAVPTEEYMAILEKRGYSSASMVRFKRGIDATVFRPRSRQEYRLANPALFPDGVTLLYAGRISKEKSMDFLRDLYASIVADNPKVNMIFAGDGPYFKEFRQSMSNFERVVFPGRLPRESLPHLYSAAHCLVFPSVTDTFGMVVLEAQACGLPAVVSDRGGPQEIVRHGKTGYVARAHDGRDWREKIFGMINLVENYPELYSEMREQATTEVVSRYDWDVVLDDIFCDKPRDHESLATAWNISTGRGTTIPVA